MIKQRPVAEFIAQGDRRIVALALGAVLALTGTVVGALLAVIGPIYTAALLVALAGGVWVIAGLRNAMWSVVAIIALLPYATLPFKVVVTPTFLDLAMGAFFFLYVGEWMTGERRRLTVTPVHGLVLLFMLLSVFSFVAGLRYAGITSTVIRRFAEFLLSMTFALVLSDVLQDKDSMREFVLVIVIVGLAAGLLAIGLWVLPDTFAESILRRLSVIGYPDSGIIRYIEENPDLPERAIATTADPNALGGFLVMIAALVAPQTLTEYPLTGKRWHAWPVLGTLVLALVLTFSRGSLLAFGAALVFIGALRYRKLLIWLGIGGAIFLILPWTQYYIARLLEGFQGADLSTQMRFGEIRDALTLIGRYPLLGVGFSGTPDVDIYLGVANVYLTIASNMGILGLIAFLALMASVFLYAWFNWRGLDRLTGLRPIQIGLLAGIAGALANGLFDHYFFNLSFHPAVTIMWTFIGLSLACSRMAAQALEQERLAKRLRDGIPPTL